MPSAQQPLLPEGDNQLFDIIQAILAVLKDKDIPVCVVGEIALNYYNVPRIVHDVELCVREADLESATSIFNANKDILEPSAEDEYNLYTEYKRGFPRFRYRSELQIHAVIFTDSFCHLEAMRKNTIQPGEHQGWTKYSPEILDIAPADAVCSLSLPRLAPFFKGLCRRYISARDPIAAIAAEQLVDGMDLDQNWCRSHLSAVHAEELAFAMTLVEGRKSRSAEFSMDSEYPDSEKDKDSVLARLPGFD